MTHHTPCPSHPGIYTDTRPCYRCPQPEEVPVTPLRPLPEMVVVPDEQVIAQPGAPDKFAEDDAALEEAAAKARLVTLADLALANELAADATAFSEKATRDTWQPTLDDALFPPVRKTDTPMVKVTISGTVELTQADYLAFLDGSHIGPGAVVEIRAAGYVVQPGAAWVKRTEGSGEDKQVWHEREGRVKVRITDLAGFAATGEEWSE